MKQIEGYVERIVFRNEENGYTVMEVAGDKEEFICFGTAAYIHQGEFVKISGETVVHPVYGEQIKIVSLDLQPPKDRLAVERYLSSGAIKGIGLALAARIVDKFGEDTYRILEEEPERLAEVHGISMRKAREIAGQLAKQQQMRKAMLFLQQYGISVQLSVKIFQQYGEELYEIVRENPYRLAEDISGVGFKIADEIAARAGILQDSRFRIRCGLDYVLKQALAEGHTYLPKEQLFARSGEILGVMPEQMEEPMMDLLIERRIICKETEDGICVYPASAYYTELSVAHMLRELNLPMSVKREKVERFFAQEEQGDFAFDPLQRLAVTQAMENGVFLLTGGPGTGKTTTINQMIRFFQKERLDFLLAAPTGRAAKRMTEATGYEAQTIHRMLELSAEGYGETEDRNRMMFSHDRENPLEADVIIIDEMSMVDIFLMEAMLKAIVPGTRLVLVGDVNQLPSVGPGSVLKDLIASECFPVVTLTHIFRQAAESDIVTNAHRINEGQPISLNNNSKDFFFLQRLDAEVIVQSILYLVRQKLPPYVEAKPFDIQVLAPMRKGALGVEHLNVALQQALNPPGRDKAEKEYKDGVFREGDKVMQIKNNYQMEWEVRNAFGILEDHGLGVFNGDMGVITAIDLFDETLTVMYDECRQVVYPFSSLDELELAYAVTIHKSQGSEYPAVVLPLLGGPRMLFHRNLLYTAVTRAKRCVTIIGSREVVEAMIANTNEKKRYTGLEDRLREVQ